jgi:hypothetical protein
MSCPCASPTWPGRNIAPRARATTAIARSHAKKSYRGPANANRWLPPLQIACLLLAEIFIVYWLGRRVVAATTQVRSTWRTFERRASDHRSESVFPGIAFLRLELVSCSFGEWRRSVLHPGMCLAACGNLTRLRNGSCDDLADNDLGTGSSWLQSKRNQTPIAAMRF